MKEEIMRVLKMVEEGKISADKGTQLIEAIQHKEMDIQNDNDKLNIEKPMKPMKPSMPELPIIPDIDAILQDTIDSLPDKDEINNSVKDAIKGAFGKATEALNYTKKVISGEKMLRVKVLSHEGDKVNINLPIKFVKGMVSACGKIPNLNIENMEGINGKEMTDTIMAAIEGDIEGRIVDIQSAQGDIVEVTIE